MFGRIRKLEEKVDFITKYGKDGINVLVYDDDYADYACVNYMYNYKLKKIYTKERYSGASFFGVVRNASEYAIIQIDYPLRHYLLIKDKKLFIDISGPYDYIYSKGKDEGFRLNNESMVINCDAQDTFEWAKREFPKPAPTDDKNHKPKKRKSTSRSATAKDKVLKHLREKGFITASQASKMGISYHKLANVIYRLRKYDGYKIDTKSNKKTKNIKYIFVK